jgi:hypothetical protein
MPTNVLFEDQTCDFLSNRRVIRPLLRPGSWLPSMKFYHKYSSFIVIMYLSISVSKTDKT